MVTDIYFMVTIYKLYIEKRFLWTIRRKKKLQKCSLRYRRYAFIPLDDFLWERFVEEMESKSQEFRQVDDPIWHLYRGIIGAVQDYKIAKEKERKNGNSQEVQQAPGMDDGRNQQT